MSEQYHWCSYYCQGNFAQHRVVFTLNGEEYAMNLCDWCLEEFLEHGPRR